MEGSDEHIKKGLWTDEEDRVLLDYIELHGKGKWNRVAKATGLKRCGKSCRLRWMNYLSPGIKRDNFSEEENDLIIRLHNLLGNRWSLIAGRVPGRTDNQVKNHWNTHLSKKLGINKRNNKIHHPKELLKKSKISIESNSKFIPSNSINIEVEGIQENTKISFGVCSSEELVNMGNGYESNISFSNDDLISHRPNFLEFLNEFCPDWHGL